MSFQRWRGLKDLVREAAVAGSRAVERVQKETAQRPFAILEAIPPIAGPARLIHRTHDAIVGGLHEGIRLGTVAVSHAAGMLLDHLDPPGASGTVSAPPDESSR